MYVMKTLKNPTKEDFSFYWNSEEYKVPAGKEVVLPDYIVLHGAKKLADKEWGDPLDKLGRKDFTASLVSGVKKVAEEKKEEVVEKEKEVEEPKEEEKEFEDLEDLEKEPWCKECGSMGVRHKKGCSQFK